jgi:hypothetical protein
LMLSGVAATRVSLASVSAGIATRMLGSGKDRRPEKQKASQRLA